MGEIKDSVEIGPLTYKIVFLDDLQDGDNHLLGQIDYDEGVIRILTKSSPEFQILTLWHEIVHGILFQYGQAQEDRSRVSREALVEAIAFGIFDVLKHNPWLGELYGQTVL